MASATYHVCTTCFQRLEESRMAECWVDQFKLALILEREEEIMALLAAMPATFKDHKESLKALALIREATTRYDGKRQALLERMQHLQNAKKMLSSTTPSATAKKLDKHS